MNAAREAAALYLGLGWAPVPIPPREKRPILRDWPNLRLSPLDLEDAFPDAPSNVGLILGAPSGGLADVDLDCQEALELAPLVLPSTWTFGRASKPRSHWLYEVSGGVAMRRYLDNKTTPTATLVELRSGRDGDKGLQTVVPPSVHPSGESVRWTEDCDAIERPRAMDGVTLAALVERLAAACLLSRRGLRAEAEAWLRGGEHPATTPDTLAELNRLRGVVPPLAALREATRQRSETFAEAARTYNAAHVYQWPRSGGTCPMCGHHGCFGSFADSGRWTCHSTGHAGVGVEGAGCWTGDALDLDAYRNKTTRAELLKAEGYL